MIDQLEILDVTTITRERAEWLWDHVRRQAIAFDDFSRDRGDLFAMRLASPATICFLHGESGLITIENIVPKMAAIIHFFLWDPKIHEADICRLGRQAVHYAFLTYELRRISAIVPSFNKLAIRVATRVGFRYEGNLRQAFLYKQNYHDVFIYGVLSDEFEFSLEG